MKKRLFPSLIVLSLLFNILCLPTEAFQLKDSEEFETYFYSVEELEIIEEERKELTELLILQLEAQDALDQIDNFMFLVDQRIQQKYYPSTNKGVMYYAPDGGWLKGSRTYIEAEAQFFTTEDTQEIYQARYSSDEALQDLLVKLQIFVMSNGHGTIGLVLSLMRFSSAISNDMLWDGIDIGEEGVVVYAVYDTLDMKTTTVLWPWDDEPYIDVDSFDLNDVTYGRI